MLAPALARIYSGHRPPLINTLSLVSRRYDIEWCLLEVQKALLGPDRLHIVGVRGLIRPISLLLNLGE